MVVRWVTSLENVDFYRTCPGNILMLYSVFSLHIWMGFPNSEWAYVTHNLEVRGSNPYEEFLINKKKIERFLFEEYFELQLLLTSAEMSHISTLMWVTK